jgi:hypothetical protein
MKDRLQNTIKTLMISALMVMLTNCTNTKLERGTPSTIPTPVSTETTGHEEELAKDSVQVAVQNDSVVLKLNAKVYTTTVRRDIF